MSASRFRNCAFAERNRIGGARKKWGSQKPRATLRREIHAAEGVLEARVRGQAIPPQLDAKGAINKIGLRVRCKTIALSAEKGIDLGRTRVGSPRHSVRPFKRRALGTRFLNALSATLTIVTMRSSILQALNHISMRVFGAADAHALFWAEASDDTSL